MSVFRERDILNEIRNNPQTITLECAFMDDEFNDSDYIYFLTDYASNGSL